MSPMSPSQSPWININNGLKHTQNLREGVNIRRGHIQREKHTSSILESQTNHLKALWNVSLLSYCIYPQSLQKRKNATFHFNFPEILRNSKPYKTLLQNLPWRTMKGTDEAIVMKEHIRAIIIIIIIDALWTAIDLGLLVWRRGERQKIFVFSSVPDDLRRRI